MLMWILIAKIERVVQGRPEMKASLVTGDHTLENISGPPLVL